MLADGLIQHTYAATSDEKWGYNQTIWDSLEMIRVQAEALKLQIINESLDEKIDRIASQYGVEPNELHAIISCESSYNPEAKKITSKEASYGLSQINTLVHDITPEQAQDPDFAIEFLAKKWSEGKRSMWYVCSKRHGLL